MCGNPSFLFEMGDEFKDLKSRTFNLGLDTLVNEVNNNTVRGAEIDKIPCRSLWSTLLAAFKAIVKEIIEQYNNWQDEKNYRVRLVDKLDNYQESELQGLNYGSIYLLLHKETNREVKASRAGLSLPLRNGGEQLSEAEKRFLVSIVDNDGTLHAKGGGRDPSVTLSQKFTTSGEGLFALFLKF